PSQCARRRFDPGRPLSPKALVPQGLSHSEPVVMTSSQTSQTRNLGGTRGSPVLLRACQGAPPANAKGVPPREGADHGEELFEIPPQLRGDVGTEVSREARNASSGGATRGNAATVLPSA